MVKRSIIFVHRWLGVVVSLFFTLWFPSGIGMMYWSFPSISSSDLLERSPALAPSTIRLAPAEAYAVLGEGQPPGQARLNTFDGRPVYRFGVGRSERIVYADTGARQVVVSKELMARVASAWTGQRPSTATVAAIDVDQWTVEGTFRDLQPVWKYSWPNGEQVYVSERSGEVVQYTTRASRLGAYFGPIPHWLYFTPLRKHQPQWRSLVSWSSGLGSVTAIAGIVIGVWMYSPSKRYRLADVSTSIPYRGPKRWHMVLGLIFGLGSATWAFSGLLSMDPFPSTSTAGPSAEPPGVERVPQALRGRLRLGEFSKKHPREALSELAGAKVKELELASFDGEPVYLATLGQGETRVVALNGPTRDAFDRQQIVDTLTKAAEPSGLADIRVVDHYDMYYLDRHRQLPLPVILAELNDRDRTRFYIDPKTARLVRTYRSRDWVTRWLYHGLHSLDFPWLYAHRPAWDLVVVTFMLGGTALSVTSLILAWKILGKGLTRSRGAP